MTAGAPIRILIVDDHPMVVAGLKALLGVQSDMAVIGEAGTGAEAIRLFRTLSPDVTLLDLRLPDVPGTDLILALLRETPGAAVIVVSSYGRPGDVRTCLEAGARGYLTKDVLGEELSSAIRQVACGKAYISRAVAARLAESAGQGKLSARERQVLELLAAGRTNEEIGRALDLSVGTVKNYVHIILAKLGVRDRAAATARAHEMGLLRPL